MPRRQDGSKTIRLSAASIDRLRPIQDKLGLQLGITIDPAQAVERLIFEAAQKDKDNGQR
jgi:hypothetical protein